jgi:hypothetical protein
MVEVNNLHRFSSIRPSLPAFVFIAFRRDESAGAVAKYST